MCLHWSLEGQQEVRVMIFFEIPEQFTAAPSQSHRSGQIQYADGAVFTGEWLNDMVSAVVTAPVQLSTLNLAA